MSLAKGSLTVRRYRCQGAPPPDSAARLVELLVRDAFRGRLDDARKTETSGWVTVENLLDTGFSTDRAYHAPYLVFALRTDRKAIPPALLKALIDQRERATGDETGLERLPPGAREEIREEIEEEYLPRILPTVSVVEVCWNLQRDVVSVLSATEKANGRIRKQFSASFSRALVPMDPLDRTLAGPDRAARIERLHVLGGLDLTAPAPSMASDGGE
ncbi:MAG: recombination-associated protein RdgC [Myxococcota bacterium]|nr:recombination-associated protein RdgC [Myxococcota bacterium]